jgi:hypothetical protein
LGLEAIQAMFVIRKNTRLRAYEPEPKAIFIKEDEKQFLLLNLKQWQTFFNPNKSELDVEIERQFWDFLELEKSFARSDEQFNESGEPPVHFSLDENCILIIEGETKGEVPLANFKNFFKTHTKLSGYCSFLWMDEPPVDNTIIKDIMFEPHPQDLVLQQDQEVEKAIKKQEELMSDGEFVLQNETENIGFMERTGYKEAAIEITYAAAEGTLLNDGTKTVGLALGQSEHKMVLIYKSMSRLARRIDLDPSQELANDFLMEIADYNALIMRLIGEMAKRNASITRIEDSSISKIFKNMIEFRKDFSFVLCTLREPYLKEKDQQVVIDLRKRVDLKV